MKKKKNKLSKSLTWNELATEYNKSHKGGILPARTLPMDTVFGWAEKQTDKFKVTKEGTICKILK